MLWDHTLRTELGTNPEDVALVLTDAPMSVDKAQETGVLRKKFAEIAFEQLGVKALTIGAQPVLSLFSTGRTRGCVVEVGDGCSFAVGAGSLTLGSTAYGRAGGICADGSGCGAVGRCRCLRV